VESSLDDSLSFVDCIFFGDADFFTCFKGYDCGDFSRRARRLPATIVALGLFIGGRLSTDGGNSRRGRATSLFSRGFVSFTRTFNQGERLPWTTVRRDLLEPGSSTACTVRSGTVLTERVRDVDWS
jgi:hypothetical protein